MNENQNENNSKAAQMGVGALPVGVAVEKSGMKLAEFLSFKYMLVEELGPLLFLVAVISLIVWSFKIMKYHFGMGLVSLVGGFLLVRISFEVVMVAFSILGVLRQIRDRLPVRQASATVPEQHEGQ